MLRASLPHCSMIVLLLHWQNSAAPTQNKPLKNNEERTCSSDRMLKFLCLKAENESTHWREVMVEFGQRLDLVIFKVFSTLSDSWFYGVTNLHCASNTTARCGGTRAEKTTELHSHQSWERRLCPKKGFDCESRDYIPRSFWRTRT